MRYELSNDLENLMKKCNSIEEICTYSKDEPQLKNELINSLPIPINLIEEIEDLLNMDDRIKKNIKDKAKLQEFYDYCYKSRHYFFK
ncbi:unnamed protein product [Rhizophagus irregularis]|nr:unnamed protein product [Rhizophagus irregularis]